MTREEGSAEQHAKKKLARPGVERQAPIRPGRSDSIRVPSVRKIARRVPVLLMLVNNFIILDDYLADAVEAAWQDVQEKAADELGGVERHGPEPVAAFDPVVLPLEGDARLPSTTYWLSAWQAESSPTICATSARPKGLSEMTLWCERRLQGERNSGRAVAMMKLRRCPTALGQSLHQIERGRIGPVQVLEREHSRLRPRASQIPSRNRRQLPTAQFLGRELRRALFRQRDIHQRRNERRIFDRVETDQPKRIFEIGNASTCRCTFVVMSTEPGSAAA